MNKFFYFRTRDTAGDDDDITSSLTIPVEKITGIQALTTDTIIMYYETELHDVGDIAFGDQYYNNAKITINITTGARKKVMEAIAIASNAGPHNDGIVTIADDIKNIYASKYITSCGAIETAGQLGPDVDTTSA